ncbi:MAG TPA: T9SS type A sorting domain-containing protein, partial [Cytophagales bacterium]|nr:T9SS type A sorting domain-containing protein [Cytophagales bacterium]
PGDYIRFVFVGDLDGDGEYDFVVDRLGIQCKAEAYLSNGKHLWTIDMGPNSTNQNGISPGSSTIDVGHWDGLSVYDLDGDGKAEVMLRGANGVRFGDGKVLTHSNNNVQFISILDGMTGAERARAQLPNDFMQAGPMACQMGIGYLNGVTPSLITFAKNRNADKSFNRTCAAWDFDGKKITMKWKTNMVFGQSYGSGSDGHQMRIGDFDGDGKDEVGQIGFVLNPDGSLKYDLGKYGIQHGDRWYVGKLDPKRPGLQGYGIQQYNSIKDYYYDAGTGQVLWMHKTPDGSITDVGRGTVGDIDPNHEGYEVWEFSGLYNGPSNKLIASETPYPNFRIWWDGDVLSENLNDEKLEKYNAGRLLTLWDYEGGTGSTRGAPKFYGDILGDWREEIILTDPQNSRLVIYTTNYPTDQRLYTMPHNPLYRNSMNIKGYLQSHTVDYYLGHNMTMPPKPNIKLVGQTLDCNSDNGGTATLDNCGRCVGGKTGKTSCSGSIEAEDACTLNGTIDTEFAGYLGSGYVDAPYGQEATLGYNLYADQTGTYDLSFRYANGKTTNRTAILTIQGQSTSASLDFAPTGGWEIWAHAQISVSLQKGGNTLLLKATNTDGLPNMDQIGLLNVGISKGNCIVTDVDSETYKDGLIIFPNPTNLQFTLQMKQATKVQVMDAQGRLTEDLGVVQHTTFGAAYPSGIYIIHLITDDASSVVKVVKE